MIQVIGAVTTLASKTGVVGSITGAIGGLFGGSARDRAREERLQLHLEGALAGDVSSARRMLTQILPTTGVIAAERERYTRGWQTLEQRRPDVAAEARRLGELRDGLFGDADAKSWASEFERLRGTLAHDLAEAVQRMGTGITNAATQAVAPKDSPLNEAVTIPTSKSTLIALAAAGVAAILLLRKR